MAKPHYRLTAEGLQLAEGGRPKVSGEAFVAASGTNPDMKRWNPLAGSPDSDLLPEHGTIVSRSRDLTRNQGVADGARQTHVDNIIGCGLRLSAKPNWRVLKRDRKWAEAWGNDVQALWQTWWGTPYCDVSEKHNGDSLTQLVFNSAWLNGEGLALPLWMPERGRRYNTCLQIIEPDRLSNPNFQPDTQTLRKGVRIDGYGKPLAYAIRKTHPGDAYLGLGMGMGMGEWEWVPASAPNGRRRVIHLHDSARTGQSRGIPALAAVMRQFKVLSDFTNAELKAAVANALVAIVLQSNMGQESLVELLSNNPDALKRYQDGLASNNRSAIDYMGAMVLPVPLGTEVKSFSPARPSTSFEPFVTTLFRYIAAGLHMPYELLMKDFSKTNYSSARAALLEAWRFFKGRRKWMADYWMSPCYLLWLEEVSQMGLIDAPDFYENWEAYSACKWIGDGRGWVDPLKEVQAADMRIKLGISTLEAECAEQGEDWEETMEQRARELQRQKELEDEYGIKFPNISTVSVANGAAGGDDEIPGGDKDKKENKTSAELQH